MSALMSVSLSRRPHRRVVENAPEPYHALAKDERRNDIFMLFEIRSKIK